MIDLRLGRWEDVLADVAQVDAVITDPPYSPRAHAGYRCQEDMLGAQREALGRSRAAGRVGVDGKLVHGRPAMGSIPYAPLTEANATDMAQWTARHCRNWIVAFGDHVTFRIWEAALTAIDWYVFAPVGWVRTGGTPRFQGDGPCNSVEWICVARPRRKTTCGSLPGHYVYPLVKGNASGKIVTGQKPVELMRTIIRHYTAPGDLVVDPFAGSATTLIAAAIEGRRAIGAEMDPATFAKAQRRLAAGYTPAFDFGEVAP